MKNSCLSRTKNNNSINSYNNKKYNKDNENNNKGVFKNRNTDTFTNSPGTEASYPLTERSQEHIYTNVNDKNKKSIPNTPGRK
ncbi:hypothetical protein PIROE2DRAFT_16835 [Piromyces sp. E2]|nr:hypothetical protein PIROE2DRAFT_16835 [Piromyces sp. E2]|eukprot:OUM58005.1 hypothetical protein PIROE2DRAFT_16835 [Piromyces sp. E2]